MEFPLHRDLGSLYPEPMPVKPADPTVTEADNASFAYFLSDPSCNSFKLSLQKLSVTMVGKPVFVHRGSGQSRIRIKVTNGG